jgi:MFS family permease
VTLTDRPTGDQFWLLAGLFTTAYGTNVSTPLLVLYQDRLGLGDGKTMTIFVSYVVGILLALVVAGPLSDRIGRRAVCVPALALAAGASSILVFGRDELLLLVLGRALLGGASGAFLGVGSAWMQELMGRGSELRAAALTTLTIYVGFGSGPMSTAVLERLFPAPLVVPLLVHVALVLTVVGGVAAVPETRRRVDRSTSTSTSTSISTSTSTSTSISTSTWTRVEFGIPAGPRRLFLLVVAPAAIWVFTLPSNSFALFPVLLRDATEGYEVLVAGLSGALTAWSAILSRPVLARLGSRRALPVAMAVGAAGLLLGALSFASDQWPWLLPAAVLLGASSGVVMTGGLAITSEIVEEESRGALTSTFYVFAYAGMITPIVVTAIGDFSSTTTALLVLTVGAAATGALLSRTVRLV